MQKSKKDYYKNLNERNICDNWNFWKVVKALLSNKIAPKEKIAILEGEEIRKTDQGNSKVLNNFLSNIIKNLDIPQ